MSFVLSTALTAALLYPVFFLAGWTARQPRPAAIRARFNSIR